MNITRHRWVVIAGLFATAGLTLGSAACAGQAAPTPTEAGAAPVVSAVAASPSESGVPSGAATRKPSSAGELGSKKPSIARPADSGRAPSKTSNPLGSVVSTGLDATQISEWVLYMAKAEGASAGDNFDLVLADRQNDGTREEANRSGDTSGKPLAAGFHAVEHPYSLEGNVDQPAFGYFVGKPAKITGTVDGRTVVAKTAKWSRNGDVTIFWFDNTVVTGDANLTTVTALDTAGKTLGTAKVAYEGDDQK